MCRITPPRYTVSFIEDNYRLTWHESLPGYSDVATKILFTAQLRCWQADFPLFKALFTSRDNELSSRAAILKRNLPVAIFPSSFLMRSRANLNLIPSLLLPSRYLCVWGRKSLDLAGSPPQWPVSARRVKKRKTPLWVTFSAAVFLSFCQEQTMMTCPLNK